MKAEYASHQLHGPTGIWWTHYLSTLLVNAQVTWNQFKATFRGHHIPPGLMNMKATKFMKLTQGTKSLTKYLHAFNNLSRYALEFVNIDAKKIASFKRGLGPKLMKTLANNKSETFNEFEVMRSPKRIRIIFMLHLRVVRQHMNEVHPSKGLQW